MLTALQGTLQ